MNMARVALVAILTMGLVASLAAAARAQTIYRVTDAEGRVTFTDAPERGGEAVEAAPVTVLPAGGVPAERAALHPPSDPGGAALVDHDAFTPYGDFRILSPSHEQAFPVGAAGNVSVALGIEPALRDEHRLRLLVDGQESQSARHTTFMVPNMHPGEHRLQAELLDAAGSVRQRSAPVTIYVHRASVNRPVHR